MSNWVTHTHTSYIYWATMWDCFNSISVFAYFVSAYFTFFYIFHIVGRPECFGKVLHDIWHQQRIIIQTRSHIKMVTVKLNLIFLHILWGFDKTHVLAKFSLSVSCEINVLYLRAMGTLYFTATPKKDFLLYLGDFYLA